jgi:hexosaminidase
LNRFQLGWLKLLEQKKDIVPQNLGGIILTGWQRFDHFASLCELLPIGIPSLCCCLAALEAGNFGDPELEKCSHELGIDLGAELRDEAPTNLRPNFPGSELYILVRSFVRLRTAYDSFMNSDVLTTWFSDHQVRTRRVSPLQLKYIATRFRDLLLDFRQLESALQTALSAIYPLPVCHEWLGTYVEPIVTKLTKYVDRTNVIARQIQIS